MNYSRHGNVAAVDDDVPQLLAPRLVGQLQCVGRLQWLLETGQSSQRQRWRRLTGRGRSRTEPVEPRVADGLIGRSSRPAGGLSWLKNMSLKCVSDATQINKQALKWFTDPMVSKFLHSLVPEGTQSREIKGYVTLHNMDCFGWEISVQAVFMITTGILLLNW